MLNFLQEYVKWVYKENLMDAKKYLNKLTYKDLGHPSH